MKLLKNLKIRAKLFLCCLLLLGITVAVAVFGVAALRWVDDEYAYAISYPLERYSFLKEVGMHFMDARRTMNRAAMYIHDPISPMQGISGQEDHLMTLRTSIDNLFAKSRHSTKNDPRLSNEEKELVGEWTTIFEAEVHHYFDHYITNLIIAARAGDEVEAIRLVREGLYTANRALMHFDMLVDIARQYMHDASGRSTQRTEQTQLLLVILTLSGVALGAVATIIISSTITKPIDKVTVALGEITKGNRDTNLNDKDISKDEIGVLTQNVLKLLTHMKSVDDEVEGVIHAAVELGDLHHIIDVDKYSGHWREIMVGLNQIAEAVDIPIVEIRDVMNSLSNNDFTKKVMGDYKGDFLQIKNAVNNAVEELSMYASRQKELMKQDMAYRMRMMFDATPLIIEFWSRDYVPIDCNQTTLDYYGLTDKQDYLTIISNFFEDVHENTPIWRENLDRIFEHGSGSFEFVDVKPDGKATTLEVHAVLMDYNGELVVATYSRDVTKIKEMKANQQQAEIAKASNIAKSRFLARMSHEIRTPITAVMGMSEIALQDPSLPPQTEESFAKIYNSANILLGIVNDILDLSKIEAGKMELAQEKYEMASTIVDVVHLHLASYSGKDIKFDLDVDEDVPSHLIGDAMRVGQIINNILSNAFKYTQKGNVKLSLRTQKDCDDPDAVTIVITVEDSGLGMTEEQIKNLSSEFTRYHEKDNRHISGTGLGMPIVFSLAQLMDAKIDVQSEVGVGTKVAVSIPQKLAGSQVLGKEAVQSLKQVGEGSHVSTKRFTFRPESMPYGKVLVVDDVDANLYVAKGLLDFYDLNVETCKSGYEAITKIEKGNVYDIVFMDHMMPGLDGIETMHKMRELGYNHPIIVLTANAMIGQAEEFIKSGFDGFVSKPIQTKYLNAVLIKHIMDKQPPEVLKAARLSAAKKQHTDINGYLNDPSLLEKLSSDFVVNFTNAHEEICQALNEGNTKKAHILAHTLKGAAGLIQEQQLTKAASHVELTIAEGKEPSKYQLNVLYDQLQFALSNAKKLGNSQAPVNIIFDKQKAIDISDTLAPLLASQNVEAMNLLDDLYQIPNTDDLCKYIKSFDFKSAQDELAALTAAWKEV
ncbi:MAG: response regulator [Defluviitaleaceae bacterium]|nr:response regulator [Defluviitaleaceae bacterium]